MTVYRQTYEEHITIVMGRGAPVSRHLGARSHHDKRAGPVDGRAICDTSTTRHATLRPASCGSTWWLHLRRDFILTNSLRRLPPLLIPDDQPPTPHCVESGTGAVLGILRTACQQLSVRRWVGR